MMATVPHVTSGSGLRKFQADEFLSDRVYYCSVASIGHADVFHCLIKLFRESAFAICSVCHIFVA